MSAEKMNNISTQINTCEKTYKVVYATKGQKHVHMYPKSKFGWNSVGEMQIPHKCPKDEAPQRAKQSHVAFSCNRDFCIFDPPVRRVKKPHQTRPHGLYTLQISHYHESMTYLVKYSPVVGHTRVVSPHLAPLRGQG